MTMISETVQLMILTAILFAWQLVGYPKMSTAQKLKMDCKITDDNNNNNNEELDISSA